MGGDSQGEEGFAGAVIAVEECDACERETFFPEPANGFGGVGLGQIFLVEGKWDGEFVDIGSVVFQEFFDLGEVQFFGLF